RYAFRESRTVLTMALTTKSPTMLDSELAYEQRLTARDQLELAVPFNSAIDAQPAPARGVTEGRGRGAWGVGDVALGWKRVLFASRNTILSGQGEIVFPVGNS